MPIANHRLDYAQTLKNAYDIDLNRFRVDAEVHATFGDLEVSIHNEEDDILIYGQDSGGINRAIRTDTDGQLQIDILSSALPTDASTASNQTNGNQKTQVVDGSGNVWGPRTGSGGVNWFPVINLEAASDGSAIALRTIQIGGSDGTNLRNISVDTTGKLNINSISGTISLPTGASTAARQDTGNTSLASIDTKLTTTNTTLSSIDSHVASIDTDIDVALSTRASEATLSLLNAKFVNGNDIGDVTINNAAGAAAVNIQDGGNSITVDGTVSVNPITFASPQHVIVDSGTITTITNVVHIDDNGGSITVDGTIAATQSGAWTTGRTWTLASGTDSVSAVQSGTWNINNITGTISLPTGAATEASLAKLTLTQGSTTSGQSGPLVQGAVTTAAPTYVTGQTSPLSLNTSGQLRVEATATIASTVTVVQPTGSNLHTVVDSGSITVNNAAGASAVNIQDGGNSITVDGTIAATQSGTWNINNISGTISLPTGAATAANQTTEITSLQLIDDIPHSQNAALNKGVPTMGQLDDTATTAATEDNVSVVRITAQRALHTNLRNNAGTEIATSANPLRTDPTGTTTQPASLPDYSSTTGTTTVITRNTVAQTALASNANRKGYVFWNDSGANCFLKFSATPTTTSYSIRLGDNTGYESQSTLRYTGIITVIWGTGTTGSLYVTEFT